MARIATKWQSLRIMKKAMINTQAIEVRIVRNNVCKVVFVHMLIELTFHSDILQSDICRMSTTVINPKIIDGFSHPTDTGIPLRPYSTHSSADDTLYYKQVFRQY